MPREYLSLESICLEYISLESILYHISLESMVYVYMSIVYISREYGVCLMSRISLKCISLDSISLECIFLESISLQNTYR